MGVGSPSLVDVAHQELAGLDGVAEAGQVAVVVGAGLEDVGDTAALDVGFADAVDEPQMGSPGGQLRGVHPVDHRHPGQIVVGPVGDVQHGLQCGVVRGEQGQRYVHVRAAQGRFPVLGAALADVTEGLGAGGHPLTELRRKAVQRLLGNAGRRLEPGVAEPHAERDRASGVEGGDRVEQGDQSPQQFPSRLRVVDAYGHVGARVRIGPGHQGGGLDVVELQRGIDRRGHDAPSAILSSGVATDPTRRRHRLLRPAGGFSRRPGRAAAPAPGAEGPPRRPGRPAPAGMRPARACPCRSRASSSCPGC